MEKIKEALEVWRSVCEEAQGAVTSGEKALILTEQMLVRVGGALEALSALEASEPVDRNQVIEECKQACLQNQRGDGDEAYDAGCRDCASLVDGLKSSQPEITDAERTDFKPRELVTLNGKQLKDLLDAAWPDRDDEDQADAEITLIQHATPFKSTDGEDMPAGIYFYWTEYPEEGIALIDEYKATK